MSVHVIRVPDLGEGIAEVELVAWHVKPGDAIAEDQGLADVMTDKASVEIPSPVAAPPELLIELRRLRTETWPAIRDSMAVNETKAFGRTGSSPRPPMRR